MCSVNKRKWGADYTNPRKSAERWTTYSITKYCPECGVVYTDALSSAYRKGLCSVCNTELKEETDCVSQ